MWEKNECVGWCLYVVCPFPKGSWIEEKGMVMQKEFWKMCRAYRQFWKSGKEKKKRKSNLKFGLFQTWEKYRKLIVPKVKVLNCLSAAWSSERSGHLGKKRRMAPLILREMVWLLGWDLYHLGGNCTVCQLSANYMWAIIHGFRVSFASSSSLWVKKERDLSHVANSMEVFQ